MASYTIQIPHSNLDGAGADMRSRLMTWEWRSKFKPDVDKVVFDFTQNEFIEPWALAQYVAFALLLRLDLGLPVTALTNPMNPANRYIESMGIQQVLQTGESTLEWDESDQNTGLHILRTHADVNRFVQSAGRLGKGPSQEIMDALGYGMVELGRNVVQHAASSIGGVAIAQYFPKTGDVQISISDRGRGLRSSLETNYPELKTDLESVKLAVLPHTSGAPQSHGPYSSPDNAGLGLFFCKEIAWRNGGTFWLASQSALLGVQGDDEGGQHRIYRRINPWEGTSVTMHLPASSEAAFADLLEVCQKLSQLARTSSGVAGLDFIEELPEGFDGVLIEVKDFLENVEHAAKVRQSTILPNIDEGKWVILDFTGVRFATQSFIHSLIYEPLRIEGSLLRLSFLGCTRATKEAIRTVAAYHAAYRIMP